VALTTQTTPPIIQFFDETGINPLPAGILVTISTPAGVAVASAWTWPLGLCNIQLTPEQTYVASFSGSFQAPSAPVTFVAAGTAGITQAWNDGRTWDEGGQDWNETGQVNALSTVSVGSYRSPSFSNQGYALEQTSRLVKRWFGSTARAPGGVAYAIAYAYGAALAALDQQSQQNLQAMRLPSCQGGQIDSWALDMIGPLFQRFPFESDQLYIQRCLIMVSRPRCSIAAIQKFVQAFYASIALESSVMGGEKLAYDVAGAMDISGGFDVEPPGLPAPVPPPPVLVWDGMTQPTLAAEFDVVPLEFVIQIGVIQASNAQVAAFDIAGGYDTSGAFDIVPTDSVLPTPSQDAPDPRLGLMINLLAKAGGTVPLYLVGSN
jgi:hypothetical protein